MTIKVPEDVEKSINHAVNEGRFASVDDAMTQAARLLLRSIEQERTSSPPDSPGPSFEGSPAKPVWELFQEIFARIPDEIWDALPTDLSEEHDHYIFGTPKQNGA